MYTCAYVWLCVVIWCVYATHVNTDIHRCWTWVHSIHTYTNVHIEGIRLRKRTNAAKWMIWEEGISVYYTASGRYDFAWCACVLYKRCQRIRERKIKRAWERLIRSDPHSSQNSHCRVFVHYSHVLYVCSRGIPTELLRMNVELARNIYTRWKYKHA